MAYTPGTADQNSVITGDWADARVHTAALAATYLLGSFKEGALTIGREFYQHEDQDMPRRTDIILPQRVSMSFQANLEEHHRANWHLLMGDAIDDSSRYSYANANACSVAQHILDLVRVRNCPDGTVEIRARILKVVQIGDVIFGGSDEAVTAPLNLVGLDDRANDMGAGGSATNQLGWIAMPAEIAFVTSDP